jgi:uncharacterized Rmd1/YagE family protein
VEDDERVRELEHRVQVLEARLRLIADLMRDELASVLVSA